MHQYACGIDVISHSSLADTPCPVRYMGKYLVVQPNVKGPLFLHADSTCLSWFQSVSVFQACLVSLGFPAQEFRVHSFYIGAVTFASDLGFSSNVSCLSGGGDLHLICFMFVLVCCTDRWFSLRFSRTRAENLGG